MTVRIKYVFAGGRKAKAAEVNTNFNDVAKGINDNSNLISQVQIDIEDIKATKANITGDSNNIFLVGETNNPLGAVNLQQVKNLMAPFIDIIMGFYVHVFPDTLGVNIFPGACYDSTREYILKSNGGDLDLSSYSAATEWHIYIIKDFSTTDPAYFEVIRGDLASPPLPNNTTKYRHIATFTKSSETKLQEVELINPRLLNNGGINVPLPE